MWLFYFFLTILGLMVGSFIGMLTYRLPRGLPLSGRSFCDICKKKLSWFENIPLLSFLLLKGQCPKCKNKIGFRYPLVELSTAVLFVLVGIFWQNAAPANDVAYQFKELLGLQSLFLYLLLLSFFVALFVIDLEFKILPDLLVFALLLVTCYLLLFLPSPLLFHHLLSGFIISVFLLSLFLLTKGHGMGFGDVKMAFVLGSILGFPESVVWILLAFLTGGVWGFILILTRKARFGQHVPFGPFLLIGAGVAFAFGEILFRWYLFQLGQG